MITILTTVECSRSVLSRSVGRKKANAAMTGSSTESMVGAHYEGATHSPTVEQAAVGASHCGA
jgi:hypothetical protein